VRQLPDFIKRSAPYRASGELAVLFVCNAPNKGAERLKSVIAQYEIDWPVLFYGDGPCVPNKEWHVSGVPIAFLVNPQGVIVCHAMGTTACNSMVGTYEQLRRQGDPAPAGMRLRPSTEGNTFVVRMELYNPSRSPLDLAIDCQYIDMEWTDGKLTKAEYIDPVKHGPEQRLSVEFNDASEMVYEWRLDAGQYESLLCDVYMRLPGCTGDDLWGGGWTIQRCWVNPGGPKYCKEAF